MILYLYCSWVSTRWQWSVNLQKYRKETAIYKKRNNTQKYKKNREHKIKNTYTRKPSYKEY